MQQLFGNPTKPICKIKIIFKNYYTVLRKKEHFILRNQILYLSLCLINASLY